MTASYVVHGIHSSPQSLGEYCGHIFTALLLSPDPAYSCSTEQVFGDISPIDHRDVIQ
jgi:hypothetical protein